MTFRLDDLTVIEYERADALCSGHGDQALFQTGWFIESLCARTLVIHIIRTDKIPFIESVPSSFLLFTSGLIVTIALGIPFSPLGNLFGFDRPPPMYFPFLFTMIVMYLITVRLVKNWFVKRGGGK